VTRGLAWAALIAICTVGLAATGVLIVLPRLVSRQWRTRYTETRA
jgi:hypothetical protein